MNDLSNDLLLQILDKQGEHNQILGRLEQKMDSHTKVREEDRADFDAVCERVTEMEHADWKRTGFFGAVMLALEPLGHYVGKKFGWM